MKFLDMMNREDLAFLVLRGMISQNSNGAFDTLITKSNIIL